MKITLPSKVLQLFTDEARKNYDSSGKIVETLSYFIGHLEKSKQNLEENFIIDGLLFPKQKCTASYVTDDGK